MAVTRSAAKKTVTAPMRENPLNLFVWEGTDKRGVKMKGETTSKNANLLRAELRLLSRTIAAALGGAGGSKAD